MRPPQSCTCLLALTLLLTACQSSRTEPLLSADLWAQDMRFSIGDQVVHVPLVAVSATKYATVDLCRGSRDSNPEGCYPSVDKLAKLGNSTPNPIPVKSVKISFVPYTEPFRKGYYAHREPMPTCKNLSQEWARSICLQDPTGGHDLGFGVGISDITFLDMKKLETLSSWLVNTGEEANYEGGKILFFRNKNATHSCPYRRSDGVEYQAVVVGECYVAIQANRNILALWNQPFEQNQSKYLERQAKFVRAFVDFGIGETENLPALKAATGNKSQ
jgi:hypothetical protein